jgi:hypoxanthine phosphoribosyltransferase
MADPRLRVLIPASRIQERIEELARQITADYSGDRFIYLLCILKGAVMFCADLARAIDRPVRIDFIGISSYGKGKTSSGEVRLTKDLDTSIEGADVLIVEDIVDSGVTLTYLMHVLQQRRPRSIRIAALLDKPERRMRPVEVTYVGFTIADEFVVGYGLDYAEEYRNLRHICVLGDNGDQ